jgi:hypothetical protein
MLDVVGIGGRRRHQTGGWSRLVLVRVTEQDMSIDTGKSSTAVLHHNTLLQQDSSGEIESMALFTASRLVTGGGRSQES